jgi:hypothetical protein
VPDPVNSQPYFLKHIVGIGPASELSCEEAVELRAKLVYQGRRGTRPRLLVLCHEFL